MGRPTLLLTLILQLSLFVAPVQAQNADTVPADEQADNQEVNLQFQVGFNALTDGDLSEAVNRFERAVNSDTEVPRAYYWLGKTYFYQGYNDSAVEVLNRAETFPRIRSRVEREQAIHRLRSRSDTFGFHQEWDYLGLVDGKRHDESRNINPSSLEEDPWGGWYSSSYRLGKVLKYSEEGKVLDTWDGFDTPNDLEYFSDKGLLVAESQADRISLLADTGGRRTFVSDGLENPTQILSRDSSLYAVDSGDQSIVQLTTDGGTAGVVWIAPPNVNLRNVSLGPDGNFWVLDDRQYQFHVISPDGVRKATHGWNRNLSLRKIWWRRNTLIGVGSGGILALNPESFRARPLSAQGDTLPGEDVSDIHFTGDQLVVSSFGSSELLIYRNPETPDPDMLVDQRRFDFSDFPVIRGNVVLQDPLYTHRFEHLGDQDLEIDVNGYDILPSILRHTEEPYGNDWILLVDNRISRIRAWEEIRPFLETVIDRSPDGTRGSLWTVDGSSVVQQSFSPSSTVLTNALNGVDIFSAQGVDRGDTLLAHRIHQAFDRLFSRRSSGGVIVVSRHVNDARQALKRVGNRSLNNGIPIHFVSPSASTLEPKSAITGNPSMFYQNFRDLNVNRIWNSYRSYQNKHYTVIYRSNLRFQASSLWRRFEFGFHYLDRIYRYDGGFLIP